MVLGKLESHMPKSETRAPSYTMLYTKINSEWLKPECMAWSHNAPTVESK